MSIDSVGLGEVFDEWGINSELLDGFEKTETTWQGREIFIQSAGGPEDEIFQEQQIAFAVIQELLQKDEMIQSLSNSEIAHILPFEVLFPDLEEELMLAPAQGINPNNQLILAPAHLQNEVHRCGLRKFWKKHKTAILITAGVIVVVAGGTIAVAMLWPSAASTVAGIGGSIGASLANNDSSPEKHSPTSNPSPSPASSAPYTPSPPSSSERVEPPKSSYNNAFTPTSPPLVNLNPTLSSSTSPYNGFQPYPFNAFSGSNIPLNPLSSNMFPLNNQPPICQEFQDIALQNNFSIPSATNNNPLENTLSQQPPSFGGQNEKSFGEKVLSTSSYLAHKTFDEVTDFVKFVPGLCEEVKELGSKLLPDDPSSPGNELNGSPMENYENFVAKGHEAIDNIFSTDQAKFFTPEAKANDPKNDLTLGMLPLPGIFNGGNFNIQKLSDAGRVLDRGGFTKAGRHLMKHGYREGSVFPKPLGTPEQINAHGQKVLESILNHPEKQLIPSEFDRYGKIVDIYAPGLGGARYNANGEFVGFLEP